MTSLAATLLDAQVPTGLKAYIASHEELDLVRRDDVFFSLMQEPAAPTPEKEQEPPCEVQTTSKEDLAGENEETSDLDKTETHEKKDLFTQLPEDAPLDEVAFPREWKEVIETTRTHETFQKNTQTPMTPAPTEEMNIDFTPQAQAVLSKEVDVSKTEPLLPHSEKIIPELKVANVQESKIGTDPALDKNLLPLTKEGASPEKDFLTIAPQIDQKENATSFFSDKKIFEKIEKTDGSALRSDLKNADQSTDNPIPFNIKTQDKDLVLSQKDPLPSFEGTPTQKIAPALKKAPDHKIPPVATNASPEKKMLSSTATLPLGFEKKSSFDTTAHLSQETPTNFSLEAPVDKKAVPSETLSPLQNAKPQEDASEMSSYKAVTLDIKMPSKDAPGSLKLRLDPANLGRVEVKVHITHDGRMDAVVSVVKSETFELLQKDAGALHKAIAEAFEQDESAMSFTLTGGEKGSSQESFTAFHKNAHTQDNLELTPGERALTYTPKPLDPARMLDALV